MTRNEHIIKSVYPGSIAEKHGLRQGDVLLNINNQEIQDVLDYYYLEQNIELTLTVRQTNGKECTISIQKDEDASLGIEFENSFMGEYKSCQNKCIFCFIDQMPKGMRETLYFKDDDSRLSFLQGNYITLTNMKQEDIRRIIDYRLGPINISVHTTNPELRCKMLNNRFAGESLKKLDELYHGEIEMNGQIVLCKGINDGDELRKTIEDLSHYLPYMRSVSVVPTGLTKYREGLTKLELFTKEDAIQVIDMIESYQKKFWKEHELHFIHASDEWYILAEREFPEEERYDDYIQLENGVGMMRLLWEEFHAAFQELLSEEPELVEEIKQDEDCHISIATGVLAYDMICQLSDIIMEEFPNVHIQCHKIINHFFGESITVSGLITGQDLIEQLQDVDLGDILLLPYNILRSGEDVFLDDITLDELKNTLQVNVNIVESSGQGFLNAILQIEDSDDEFEKWDNGNFVYIKAYDRED